ncbi:FAD-dependent oxidoreductase [Mycobacterium sp. UM_Kg27]|uniref:NAD(P)/FAD-dependent oxidoreductase n=1 Tax=Mycobacterium sp. UM_Kg27 TaxID=1545693 RepID=UPI00061B0A76|nr:FAD-dependent oxidoreductase [Mycobacterium sp. UM_Kg27]
MHSQAHRTRSIAVVGSGIAGLTAAYILSHHNRVTLYEAAERLGGHAHTHLVEADDGSAVAVDSAFLVYNDRTYPTLCRLFAKLGVEGIETDMSMSVRNDATGLEYAGARGASGLFASPRTLHPRNLVMLAEIRRFHGAAKAVLQGSDPDDLETVGDFLLRHGFSAYFRTNFMTPLVAAVWSCRADDALDYPARYLFTFLEHHGMLSVFGSPTWRTVAGGSINYVRRIATTLDEVLTDTAVTALRRVPDGVLLRVRGSRPRHFDAAVVAVHPDQALRLLDQPTAQERAVLGAMPYSTNHAQLHTDESVLPRHLRARASWNYRVTPDRAGVLVTYDVSRLMHIDSRRRYLVTLGGSDLVDRRSVLAEMTYQHPLFTPQSVAAQRRLPELGDDRIVFAGAYHGWGFHEDGAVSGVRAAWRLGADWAPAAVRDQACAC